MSNTEEFRAEFLGELKQSGTVSDPRWLAAFRDITRDAFVPYYFAQAPDRPGWVLVEPPSAEWLRGVYSTRALVTQIDGNDSNVAQARIAPVRGVATSSSSAPTLMSVMLHALDVQDGHRVLEIGTGTGYNAALLCHRLGSGNVTSIDIDPGLVGRARERLAALGYSPAVEVADGNAGYPDRAPFDRIIATVGLAEVPDSWIAQVVSGGKILVPLDLSGRGGLLALLTVGAGGAAEGNFLDDFGGFMPVRANQHQAGDVLASVSDNDGETRETTLAIDVATDPREPFEFFAALIAGGYDWLGFVPSDGGPPETWLTQRNGSWVCHVTDMDGKHTIRQGGPVRLWDRIESAHREWRELGEPQRQRFGLTVRCGQHVIWLDQPDGPHRWTLANASSGLRR